MENLISFITHYGVYAMILMVFLEYACFPVSSEILLPLSGAVAAATDMGYLPTTLVCSIAGLLGTYLIYLLSRSMGNKLKLDSEKLAGCIDIIEKKGKYAVCISRIIPLFRTYIAFAAGLSGMSRRDYLTWSFLGIVVWNSILIACGYILGNNWTIVSSYYQNYKYIIGAILAMIFFLLIIRKVINKSKHRT